MIYDISQEILSCNVYPGDPEPSVEKMMDMNKGDMYNLTSFSMCCHNGTHLDAPAHFIKDGKTIDMMPAEHFTGMCWVAHCSGNISAEQASKILSDAQKIGCRRILIAGNAVVTEMAASVFATSDILLLGVESQSVGPVDTPATVHKILLSKEIVLLEGIVLNDIEPGAYFLCCMPLNIKGAEGSPCRAILIKD